MNDNELAKGFGSKLKKLREESGLMQEELAKELGISRYHISNIETERSGATLKLIYRIAIFFNVSLDYLLGLTNDRNINSSYEEDIKTLLSEALDVKFDGVTLSQKDKKILLRNIDSFLDQMNQLKKEYNID